MKKILGIQKYINKITLSYVMVGIYYIVSVYAMLYCRLKVVHNLLVLRCRIYVESDAAARRGPARDANLETGNCGEKCILRMKFVRIVCFKFS